MDKSAEAFRTIGEVAAELDVPKHVLRFWEGKFPQIRPMKRGGGRRYYRPEDMELLRGIRHLLHAEGYTIKGVQKILREQGVDQVKVITRAAIEAAAGGARGRRKARNEAKSASTKSGSAQAVEGATTAASAAASAKSTPEQASSSSSGATSRSPRAAAGSPAHTRDVVAAAIRELQACRMLLSGLAPTQMTAEEPARAGAGGR